jgi:hypothetical protein
MFGKVVEGFVGDSLVEGFSSAGSSFFLLPRDIKLMKLLLFFFLLFANGVVGVGPSTPSKAVLGKWSSLPTREAARAISEDSAHDKAASGSSSVVLGRLEPVPPNVDTDGCGRAETEARVLALTDVRVRPIIEGRVR